jgi:hypothetical protein
MSNPSVALVYIFLLLKHMELSWILITNLMTQSLYKKFLGKANIMD